MYPRLIFNPRGISKWGVIADKGAIDCYTFWKAVRRWLDERDTWLWGD